MLAGYDLVVVRLSTISLASGDECVPPSDDTVLWSDMVVARRLLRGLLQMTTAAWRAQLRCSACLVSQSLRPHATPPALQSVHRPRLKGWTHVQQNDRQNLARQNKAGLQCR